jgi:Holliday junction resolvase-like predicted endonuclease
MNIHRSWDKPARFDVVSIEGGPDDMKIEWLSDAFQPGNG